MKRLIRLALMCTLGIVGILFLSRNSLLARFHVLGLIDEGTMGTMALGADSYEPVLLTEWLAGDIFRVSLAPAWMPKEGATVETMRAYTDLHEARQDSDALTEEQKRAMNHQKTKDLIIDRLVAREIHLLEAANGWLEQDRTYGHAKTDVINQVYPGDTQVEKYCNRVIRELEVSAWHQPNATYRDAFLRAKAEFQVMKIQGSLLSSN